MIECMETGNMHRGEGNMPREEEESDLRRDLIGNMGVETPGCLALLGIDDDSM